MKAYKYVIIAIISLTLASCTGFNKLLKSNDTEAKYHEGIKQYRIKKYNKALTLFQNIMTDLTGK